MGRTVFAEERLLDYLKSLTRTDGYTVGLILGQSTRQGKDYVVHLARTPPPATKDVIEESLIVTKSKNFQMETETKYIKCLEDIPNNWVADHAKHVTKMLPGGMRVLGVFVAGPGDSLDDQKSVQTLKCTIGEVQRNLATNEYLYADNQQENLVLSFNSLTQKCTCKSLDARKGGAVKSADWKFRAKITRWHSLETRVDFDRLFVLTEEDETKTLKKQLQDILKSTASRISSAIAVIEGEVRASDEPVVVIVEAKKDLKDSAKNGEANADEKMLQVSLYMPHFEDQQPTKSSTDIDVISCSGSIKLVGQLVSRTFVHETASIAEATEAVKEDVVRSLATRLEMHWDSLIEEENGSPEQNVTLHEPPRRVLVELPQSKITLSDYLFPGEGPQEALISLQELLDLEVQESSVQKEIERQVDPSEFYCQYEKNAEPTESGKLDTDKYRYTLHVLGLVVGFLMVLISIFLQYYPWSL